MEIKKGFVVLLLFLIAIPFSFASWPMYGADSANSFETSSSIGGHNISAYTHTIPNSAAGFVPIAYDFDLDGNDELISYSSGQLTAYRLNSSGQFSVLSSSPTSSLVSNLVFDPTRKLIYAYSNTTFYIYPEIDGILDMPISVALSNPVNNPQSGAREAPGCTFSLNEAMCIIDEDGMNYEIINITSSSSYIQRNYSSGFLGSGSARGYKPAMFPVGIYEYGVLYCNQSSRYGIMIVNLTDGAVWRKNCTLSSGQSWGSPAEYSIAGAPSIVYQDNAGTNAQMHYVKASLDNLIEPSGFPVGTGTQARAGALWGGSYFAYLREIGASNNGLMLYNLSGGNFRSNSQMFSQATTDFVISQTSDFFAGNGFIVDKSDNRSQSTGGGASYPYQIFFTENGATWMAEAGSADIRIHPSGEIALTYPNSTIYLRNSISNTSIGVTDFYIYDNSGSPYSFITTMNDASIELGALLSTTQWNITFAKTGYLPFTQKFNVTNGTRSYYFYAVPNATGTNLHISLIDSKTGLLAIANISISVYFYNTTSSQWQSAPSSPTSTINGTIDLIDYPASNYSFALSPSSGYQSKGYGDLFENGGNYLGFGDVDLELNLDPMINLSGVRPRVNLMNLSVTRIALTDVSANPQYYTPLINGTYWENVTQISEPSQFCINQSIRFDMSSVKQDSEAYVVKTNTGKTGASILYFNSDPMVSLGVIRLSSFTEKYNESGNYTILSFGVSATYPIATQLYPGSPYVLRRTIEVTDCGLLFDSAGNELASIVAPPLSDSQAKNAQYNLLWGVIIWIIASLAVGGFMAGIAHGDGFIFGLASGITGIGVSIILALPIIGWLPAYFTLILSLASAAAIAISIRMGMTG